MLRLLISLAAITLALTLCSLYLLGRPPTQEEQKKPLRPFMQQKLDYSKEILEGLATEDFDQINKNAQALGLLSLESNWQTLNTMEYLEQSSDFRRSVKIITDAAKERNIDRAALGYVRLTVQCVECHSYLRKNAAR